MDHMDGFDGWIIWMALIVGNLVVGKRPCRVVLRVAGRVNINLQDDIGVKSIFA